jgi:glycosyltransferase involved in cell wall biosynthesis
MTLRRWRANSQRIASANVWPIDEKAGATPPGWPGWPEGKRFALVLTHDVKETRGFNRVERVMNMELQMGFRSSFNFVPEGEYRVTEALRETLDRAGFEMGVHGLQTDGQRHVSKSEFRSKVARITESLRKWKASGFSSRLGRRGLAWLNELGIEYDSSTFDTDPFTPEPDGVETVFPFWVPGPNGTGYVELPYTIPQDFTIFVMFGERDIDTWKRKLDWVAARGGMALLKTHPDHMYFEGDKKGRDEYPVSYYQEFLRYTKEKYQDIAWHALPREVARFYCAAVPTHLRNTRKRICMVAYTFYDSDNRVRRYAEALAKRGDQVDVIALSSGNAPLGTEEMHGVTLHRIQYRESTERSRWTYANRLLRFLFASSLFLARHHRRARYDLIHVHNVPDFLVFAAWYPKWTGTKLILDIHDIVPELFASKFKTKANDLYFGFLKLVEKASTGFVDHVIVSNHLWHEKMISRSVSKEKSSVFLNHVDPAIFYRRPRSRSDGKYIILFPGSYQWHQGLDIAIRAFALMKDKVPNAEFHIHGGGPMEAELVQLAKELGLNETVKFCGGRPLDQMADVIANADLGVVPKRADSFGNEAYSTKIMEFMSQGVPVVVSRTKIDTFYFDDSEVRFFPSGDAQAMADAMLEVIQNKVLRESLIAKGYEYVDRHGWENKKREYLDLVDSLS